MKVIFIWQLFDESDFEQVYKEPFDLRKHETIGVTIDEWPYPLPRRGDQLTGIQGFPDGEGFYCVEKVTWNFDRENRFEHVRIDICPGFEPRS